VLGAQNSLLIYNCARVDGNVLTREDNKKSQIHPEKFISNVDVRSTGSLTSWVADLSNLTDGEGMFGECANLTTFVGDLSSLTNGYRMFYKCNSLTSFTSDLSSLTNGQQMFYTCILDAESLECIAETLPTVSSGNIDIGDSTYATEEVIATIKGKGWTLMSNGVAL
jgi:hypothetical protein